MQQPYKVSKKEIALIYNRLNKDFYAAGASKNKIEISENRLMIFANHKRIPALKILRKNYPELVSAANAAIDTEFKAMLKEEIIKLTGLPVVTVLKDYDAESEHNCTVIYFEGPIEEA